MCRGVLYHGLLLFRGVYPQKEWKYLVVVDTHSSLSELPRPLLWSRSTATGDSSHLWITLYDGSPTSNGSNAAYTHGVAYITLFGRGVPILSIVVLFGLC